MLATLLWVFLISGTYEQLTSIREITIENVYADTVSKTMAEVNKPDSSTLSEEYRGGEATQTLEVRDLIVKVAKEKGFENVEGLLNLAHCESRFTPTAFNPTNNSNDRGIYQISKRWHPEVSDDVAYSPKKATEWTIERLEAGYGYEWMCFHSFNDKNYERI